MLTFPRAALPALFALVLSACATQPASVGRTPAVASQPTWAFEASDIPVDPGYRFGRLDNGMRFVVRHNATPQGTALVRMEVRTGSLDEAEDERGFAHFVEHMAFNGSTRVPEGEMVRLLERSGLAFGADTNAQTGFEQTTYMLDLPRNDPALLDTALMLMRETASELTIAPEAVERERGVILAEMRDRNTWQLRAAQDQAQFTTPDALYPRRFPIGTPETLKAATAASLRAFWQREYVPAHTTVIVIGDFPAEEAEAAIRKHFAAWAAAPAERQPDAGPVNPRDKGRTDIFLEQALSERVVASRNGAWQDEPDSVAQRQENLLRQIGYAIVNRRLERLTRQESPPFRSAGFGSGDIFRSGRSTNLVVDTADGKWQRGLTEVALEYRKAMAFGFTEAEVAEQLANIRTAAQNAAASADTRSHAALIGAVFALLRNDVVPSPPQDVLARLEEFAPSITPDRVLAALAREALPLKAPLIRLQGRKEPEGGAKALRDAWNAAMRLPIAQQARASQSDFAYASFGTPGAVVADAREAALGIRQVRFANGVRLNIKRTDLEKDRVLVRVAIDGGDMLDTRANPLATAMVSSLSAGGLGRHSQDELQTILAGRTVAMGLDSSADTFTASAQTTARDLDLQLRLMAALITDPGYRKEGEVLYRLDINNLFARLRATPASAVSNALGGILSDDDPRFTLQPVEDYRKLTFARLKQDIAGQLASGAIEIGMVGDIDEDQAIALVAASFGALPARAPDFASWDDQRTRPFTANRSPRVVRHTGAADQALLRYTWPTRDDSDLRETLALELLERVVRIELTETLREKLGKAYSPVAGSAPSDVWRGYGVFALAASVDVREVPATRKAIAETIARLRDAPVGQDELLRARQPLLEAHANALKSNRGWLALVDRSQTQADLLDRYHRTAAELTAITPEQVQALARRYLAMADAVEVLALPEGIDEPAP